jgi:hypothetical protein
LPPVGYAERDLIRDQDSINMFEEVLQQVVKHDVDFDLLPDLFLDNRPSRDACWEYAYRFSGVLAKLFLLSALLQNDSYIYTRKDETRGMPPVGAWTMKELPEKSDI